MRSTFTSGLVVLAATAALVCACSRPARPAPPPGLPIVITKPLNTGSPLATATTSPAPLSPISPPSTPTALPAPAATVVSAPLTASPADAACVGPESIAGRLGQAVCLQGTVSSTENNGTDFVMWIGSGADKVMVLVHSTFYLGVEGSCLRITGMVAKDDQGRVFIRADNPDQVNHC